MTPDLSATLAARRALLDRYAASIRALPDRSRLAQEDLRIPQFLLHQAGELEIYYAPFEHLNPDARVLFLGITPGWRQMEIAYRVARDAIQQGCSADEVLRRAKVEASFAGSMRTNLIGMLDELGLPDLLGVTSSASLFDTHRALIHTTSVIRHPVFTRGCNYTGSSPAMLNSPVLLQYVDVDLAEELAVIQNAIVIPLGKAVGSALERLCARDVIERERCLFGLPHPSGANGHRHREFSAKREQLEHQLTSYFAPRPLLPCA